MVSIIDFFHLGGFGMYPTLLVGVWTLTIVFRAAITGRRLFLPPVLGLAVATVVSGLIGFSMGFIRTAMHVQALPPDERGSVVLIGLAESLHNLVLAGMFLFLIAAASSVLLLSRGGAARA